MKASKIVGCLASAAAILGCVPGTVAYGGGLWAGVRQSVGRAGKLGKVLSGGGEGPQMDYQNIEPRAQNSDPPYGHQPPPLTDKSSSASATSTWDGEIALLYSLRRKEFTLI
jgi:hypothetical protein